MHDLTCPKTRGKRLKWQQLFSQNSKLQHSRCLISIIKKETQLKTLLGTQQNINSNHSSKIFHGFLLNCLTKLGISDVITRSTYKWPFNLLWALSLEDLNHRVKHHHWARNNRINQPITVIFIINDDTNFPWTWRKRW